MANELSLQVYRQTHPHDDLRIVGTCEALKRLGITLCKLTADRACGEPLVNATLSYYDSAGEGYRLHSEVKTDAEFKELEPPAMW